jgi:hypothetical protein
MCYNAMAYITIQLMGAAFRSMIADGEILLKRTDGQRIVQSWQFSVCKLIPTIFMPSGCIGTLRFSVQFKALLNSFETSLIGLMSLTSSLEEDLQQIQVLLDAIKGVSTHETRIILGDKKRLVALDKNFKALLMINKYHKLATQYVLTTSQELQGMTQALKELRPLVSRAIIFENIASLDTIVRQVGSGRERLEKRNPLSLPEVF